MNFVLVVLIVACAPAAESGSEFEMVPPLRITRTDIYLDGGTCSFDVVDSRGHALVGGFDGRMQALGDWLDDTVPRHCYVGAQHPTEASARLLPLWGDEERALLNVLDTALDSELTPEQRSYLLTVKAPGTIDDQNARSLYHLVQHLEGRKRLLRCIDNGLPACEECLAGLNGARSPATIQAVTWLDTTSSFEVSLHDADGKAFVIAVPADSVGPDFGVSVLRGSHDLRLALGSTTDRCVLTTLSLAKSATRTGQYQALMRTVRLRIRNTFAADADRHKANK